jgi:hypothetical protein
MRKLSVTLVGRGLLASGVGLLASAVLLAPGAAAAPSDIAPALGAATTFSVLAGSTATNTGTSVISGDVGVSPGSATPGFGTAVVGGTFHNADTIATTAQVDMKNAYDVAAGQATTSAAPADLDGLTLVPGVYTGPTLGMKVNGTLTLDNTGDPSLVWVFQASLSTLIMQSGSRVLPLDPSKPIGCRVFWQVSSSATLGTGSTFIGTILADQSITLNSSVTVDGRLLAHTGAVTLDSDTIAGPTCAGPPPTTTTVAATTTSTVPGTTTTTGLPATTTTTGLPATTTTTGLPATTTTTGIPATTTTTGLPATTTTTGVVLPPGTTTTVGGGTGLTTTTTRSVATSITSFTHVAGVGGSVGSTGGSSAASSTGSSTGSSQTSASGTLPTTGANTWRLVLLGLASMLGGALLVLLARRSPAGAHHRPKG